MTKEPHILVGHILESIEIIEGHLQGITRDQFLQSVKTQDAVVRRLEIIGEAVNQLPDEFRAKDSDVPWHKITGMRNVLAHAYFAVDLELVWNTITEHLPKLKASIGKL